MKTVHFFKFKSRLGLITIPYGQTEMNIGVETAPDVILSEDFLNSFPSTTISNFSFPKPEDINKTDYYSTLARISSQYAAEMTTLLAPNELQVTLGGDHSITYSSLLSLSHRIDLSTIAYLQIDSHADMNTIETSPTGNFHGMYVRAFLGGIGNTDIDRQVKSQLNPDQMMYIGNLDLDPEEKRFFEEKHVKNFNRNDIIQHKEALISDVQKFVQAFPHVHLTFDIDSLDHSIALATGIPAKNGLFMEDVLPIIQTMKQVPSFSFDLVEVNPQKKGGKETVQIAQKILLELLR